jgi:splicing factor 3B subunit 1
VQTSPHLINNTLEAIEGMRLCLGPSRILQYVLQGAAAAAVAGRAVC